MGSRRLSSGDLLPRLVEPPPGPLSRQLSAAALRVEASEAAPVPRSGAEIFWAEALGSNALDVDGNIYIDLTSGFGVASIGHRHPAVVKAIRRQSKRLLHGLGDAQGHALRVELARELGRRTPFDQPRCFFAISGSDAVEIALKTALLATGRHRVLAFTPSYHGVTLGALHATSRPDFRDPFAGHLGSHVDHLPYGSPIADVTELLGRQRCSAVLFEPIVGREGVLLPPPGWLEEVAHAARAAGSLVVADEIFTGFGRTGCWFASTEELKGPPDLICCGKALGGGLPISVVVGSEEVLAHWNSPGEARHTATFVANPLACASALATLEVLADDDLVQRAGRLGETVRAELETWPDLFASVVAVRGRGLLWGIEWASREAASAFTRRALSAGLILLAGGPHGCVAQFVPPLSITREQLSVALGLLSAAAAHTT